VQRTVALLLASLLLLPAQAVFADDNYQTVNGPRTLSAMAGELRDAGYPGPWDPQSVVLAYVRTSGGSVATPPGFASTSAPATGRTFVLLIGGLDSKPDSTNWDTLHAALGNAGYADGDVSVFGYSGNETCQPMRDTRQSIATQLRQLRSQWSHAILIGHSLGGAVAVDVLTQERDLTEAGNPFISRVVTIDSPLQGIGAGGVSLFDSRNGGYCAAAHELRARKNQGPVWSDFETAGAQAALDRGVQLLTVENDADNAYSPNWANLADQSIYGGLPILFEGSWTDGSFTNHTAALKDFSVVQHIAQFVGSQGQ
jgi:pimeloyl-ACP methyl ester carboxylesterase